MSKPLPHAILPLGDSAVYVEFSEVLDLEVNEAVQQLAAAVRAQEIGWLRDIVPALGGLALHFDPEHPELPAAPLDAARQLVDQCLRQPESAGDVAPRVVEIPVCYELEFAPDLEDVARQLGLSCDEVVRRHSGAEYRVLMVGFVPGHPYLGGLDTSLMVPRRSTPRARVAAGSISIANAQSSIYPFEIPGGWNLIGRTPVIMFDAGREPCCLLAPRDRVRFVPIECDRVCRECRRGWRGDRRQCSKKQALAGNSAVVLRPGMLSSVQDLGRPGLQHLGIVPGGVMDARAHQLANVLVGNSRNEATLEITMIGPELRFAESVLISLSGAQFDVTVNGEKCPQDRPVLLSAGARLHISHASLGGRAYLAIAGGIRVDKILGSRSTYLPAGIRWLAGSGPALG